MNDNPLHLEWTEEGLSLTLDLAALDAYPLGTDSVEGRLSTSDALHLYEHVQDVLGAWYAEAAAARRAVARGATLAEFIGDPETWRSDNYDRMVSAWDNREGK